MGGAEGLHSSIENMEGGAGGVRTSEWKDIPVELLMRILSLVDDRTAVVASGVCCGWRDAVSWGLIHLSLSWYIYIQTLYIFFLFLEILGRVDMEFGYILLVF